MASMKLKKGDKVRIIAGKYKGKEGKILSVDQAKNRIIVEGVNMVAKHQKPNMQNQQGGIIHKENYINASNAMYLHNGKPTRIGYEVTKVKVGDREKNVKHRIAKSTGDKID